MTSIGSPSSVTVSRTTRASTPLAIFLVLSVTSTTTFCSVPVVSVSRYAQRLPGFIGHQRLSVSVVNRAGSSSTGSLP
ncbi:MAG: hypothetical protein JJE10_08750 [Thermoleophilia bacterium]|nr:hypothetical protein [Thermoleophilia bacterium]